jgi:flagellar biosynthesis protein FlhF
MKIKKITGPSLKAATEKMKAELGEDAVILSTKVYEKDNRKIFEITAGIDENIEIENKQEKKTTVKKNSTKQKEVDFESELKKLTDKIYKINKEKKSGNIIEKKKEDLSGAIKDIEDLLIHREVDASLVKTIIADLNSNIDFINQEQLDAQLHSILASMIPTSSFSVEKGKGPKIITLVGPTGVGKTTCIAKLALISKIIHKLEVGLISIDTYRLGALDQLKIFAEVSNIDFEVAYEPSDVSQSLKKFKKKDLVFIDTVGRSQRNTKLLNDIKKFLEPAQSDEVYLVMSATSTTRTLIDIAKNFKIFNYNGFIFTKLDEAIGFGNILNLTARFDIPVKYLTNGQVIPDDIIAADSDFIANLIISGTLS